MCSCTDVTGELAAGGERGRGVPLVLWLGAVLAAAWPHGTAVLDRAVRGVGCGTRDRLLAV